MTHTLEEPMGVFVRAVITGFGFSLGKLLFDKAKERLLPEDCKEPERVIIVNPSEMAEPSHDSGLG